MNNNILDDLNNEQKAAILIVDGPVRILAGAGSGKTKVLTRKIAYLVENCKVNPQKILALTFTNKAANEMKERVENLIGEKVKYMTISTFHSLCVKFLRHEIDKLNGYQKSFNILDSVDQQDILKEIYKKYSISSTAISYYSMLEFISFNKINFISPQTVESSAQNEIEKIKAKVYLEYDQAVKENKMLDFDDLLIFTKTILEQFDSVKQKWQEYFEYFLIDEFQDTSKIQYDIITHLAKSENITIVGDPDQTIYTWRGADISFINDFDKLHPTAKTITLKKNYRSTKKILNAANLLIKNNPNRLPKVLVSDNADGEEIDFYHGVNQETESTWVVSKINQLRKSKVQLKDIAILYRSNFYTRAIEDALINESIPHKIINGQKFYERAEIKDTLSFLKCVWKPDNISLKRIINIPARKIGPATLEKLIDFAHHKELPLYESWIKHFKEIKISNESKENLINFINLLRKHKALLDKKIEYHKVLNSFLNEIGYLSLIKDDTTSTGTKLDNVQELIKSLKTWQQKNPNKTLDDYFEDIALISLTLDDSANLNYISLMTIHAAKGLEFKNVFIIGMNEEIFPSIRAIEDIENEDKMEEERRLAYVAITRAKERLFLSGSRGMNYETKKTKQPSRFLAEMGISIDSFVSPSISMTEFENELKIHKNYNPGDRIMHTNFGEGIVLEISGDTIIIEFKNKEFGVKQLLKNHKSIERL